MLFEATRGGHTDLCLKVLQWGATDFNEMLIQATDVGNRSLCALAKESGANNFDEMLEIAASGARYDLCLLAREWGANTDPERLGDYLEAAAEWGAERTSGWNSRDRREVYKVCELLLRWGAGADRLLEQSAGAGDQDLCRLAKENGATDFDAMLRAAVMDGHRELCVLAREWGAEPEQDLLDEGARESVWTRDREMC